MQPSLTPATTPTSQSTPHPARQRGGFPLSGDALLSAGLRYGLLALYAGSVYIIILLCGGVGGPNVEFISPPWWLNLIALLLIAATFLPVHNWLRDNVNRLVYDWHDDPYTIIHELHQHIDLAPTPQTVVMAIAATIAETLRLPYVAIETDLGAEPQRTTYGTPRPHAEPVTIPLVYRGVPVGTLHTAARRPHDSLSASDLHLLNDLARQVVITLHATHLSDALQASREQLVLAREEERRRIRRDLHDSLGPTLASLRLQLTAVRRHLRDNPAEAEQLIDDLRDDVRTATADIRRLVYDLRPPMLDEFGLSNALRTLAPVNEGLTLVVDMPDPMPLLPAALEVALYRITAEALHNIARHAGATHCSIQLTVIGGTLTLAVKDDGRGLPLDYLAGVGHRSMQERAAELGGTVSIASASPAGTCVTAAFPLKEIQETPYE